MDDQGPDVIKMLCRNHKHILLMNLGGRFSMSITYGLYDD
jgi:hypothetical protein